VFYYAPERLGLFIYTLRVVLPLHRFDKLSDSLLSFHKQKKAV